ncbi:MAG: TIGR01777 family protein [Saprospiraceae bacterium]|nr:TIGR01777 family protein [Saprospiraceae bacterium]
MSTSEKKIIWLAGGDGLVGKHLIGMLDPTSYHIAVLSRRKRVSVSSRIEYILWDTEKQYIDSTQKPDFIINLAGAGIADQRWTDWRKKELVSSRVNSASTIEKYLKNHNVRPSAYISASAVGYYGHRGDEILTETSPAGDEFMAECCIAWEQAASHTGKYCERTIILRIGIVMSMLGGALPKILMTKGIGVFNYFGNGRQYYPWIHISDLCNLLITSIADSSFSGVYNAVAPQEITNRDMMAEIMNVNQMKGLILPAPVFGLRIALGEMANVVLNSDRIRIDRLLRTNFKFKFEKIGDATKDLIALNI